MRMNKKLFLIVPAITLLLTGCFDKTVSKENMIKVLEEAESAFMSEQSLFTNVRIRNKIQHSYDYKEGEFYRYHEFALIYYQTECIWVENGEYYHYLVDGWNSKLNVDAKVSKEEFDELMGKAKNKITNELFRPIDKAYQIATKDDPTFKNTYKSNSGTYTVKSERQYVTSEGQSETEKYVIKFKNNLPTRYQINNNGEQDWKYQYGKAEFINPHNQDND